VLKSVFTIVKLQLDCDRNDVARDTCSDMIAIVYSCADDGLQRKWDGNGERKASAFSLRTRVLCGVSRRP
jgi:hypothetical protein